MRARTCGIATRPSASTCRARIGVTLSGRRRAALGFEERFALLIDREVTERDNKRLKTRLRYASLRQNAVLYYRVPRLFDVLALARGDGRLDRLLRSLARVELLILDDWGLSPLTADQRRDLLEIWRIDTGAGPPW